MFSSSPVTLIRRVSDRRRTIRSSRWRTSSLTNTGRRLTILGTCRKVERYSSSESLRCLLLTRWVTVGGVFGVLAGNGALFSSITAGKRECPPCFSPATSADGEVSVLGAESGCCPARVCLDIPTELLANAPLTNSSSSVWEKSLAVFFILFDF